MSCKGIPVTIISFCLSSLPSTGRRKSRGQVTDPTVTFSRDIHPTRRRHMLLFRAEQALIYHGAGRVLHDRILCIPDDQHERAVQLFTPRTVMSRNHAARSRSRSRTLRTTSTPDSRPSAEPISGCRCRRVTVILSASRRI
ncbi:hypothetical protein M432DRAFT_67348 [Thermoascus aurantiacus ATCC 26904]